MAFLVALGFFALSIRFSISGSMLKITEPLIGIENVIDTASTSTQGKSVEVLIEGFQQTQDLGFSLFNGSLCSKVTGYPVLEQIPSPRTIPILVNVTFNCYDLYKRSVLGSGNFVSMIYALRLAANTLGSVRVVLKCDDAEEDKKSLILPWFMGDYPAITHAHVLPSAGQAPSISAACEAYESTPLLYMYSDMVYELRRMAIALVGVPSHDHPSALWAEEYLWSKESGQTDHTGLRQMQLPSPQKGEIPLYPEVELDDVMIHFRCGDIIKSNHKSFGFMKFGSYSRHISQNVTTIGIATQPFAANSQNRDYDGTGDKKKRCRLVVGEFVKHLQGVFPTAQIRIHNDGNETIALTFARMVMAQQTIIGISSFGVFPGIATFGNSFIRYPDYIDAPNRWLLNPSIDSLCSNVKLIHEEMMFAPDLRVMWKGARGARTVLGWFKSQPLDIL